MIKNKNYKLKSEETDNLQAYSNMYSNLLQIILFFQSSELQNGRILHLVNNHNLNT